MSAEAPAVVATFKVGTRQVRLTIPRPGSGNCYVAAEWTPDMPRALSASEWKQYRAGRNAAIRQLGMRALIIEV